LVEVGASMIVASLRVPVLTLSPFSLVLCHQRKQLIAQIMRLKEMQKRANRGLVRRRFSTEIDTYETPHRPRVIQRFFHRRIQQIKPVLQKMYPQHALKP